MTVNRPRLIVVLGMHRSGTSVTTNLINAFGVPLSDDLMEPTAHNARGYFESKEISRLHDAVLARMGMDWKTTGFDIAFPSNWWHSPMLADARAELAAIAVRELQRHGGLWGFKDPRTARLLPLWRDIISEIGADARYLLVIRHPSEVAGSLFNREAMPFAQSEALWLEHNLDAVTHTNGELDAIIDYSEWMTRPVEQARYMLERAGLSFEGSAEDFESKVRSIISPDLRHNQALDEKFHLPLIKPVYDALKSRNLQVLTSLGGVFGIIRGFTNAYTGYATRAMKTEMERLLSVAYGQAGTIAQLEAEVRAMHSMLASPVMAQDGPA